MDDKIKESLKQIEEDYQVKILYACESGSRAWQFPSKDSDYDVRFIYVHKEIDYLTIDPIGIGKKRDVIELPIDDMLDITGWELTKALRLFRKSNQPLMEWLRSGIVYYEAFSAARQMKELSSRFFSPVSGIHHYLNMADGNFREYLQGERVKIKKYFYVLRPILAALWIEKFNEFPPLAFPVLLEELLPDGELKDEISILLKRKMEGDELDMELKIPVIHDFLAGELQRLREYANSIRFDITDFTYELDALFRDTLDEAWKSR
ncbi:nucleotidyltransferase domain-containing protein [Peribacillus sp. SCS-26]|uniref:nucleotidyltransferase domain-containing protein n=1 Tax=Paraperibacillus marinus TaxID=3115295 RepID=UPI003905B799